MPQHESEREQVIAAAPAYDGNGLHDSGAVPAPVAEWDFRRGADAAVSLDGVLGVRNAAGSRVTEVEDQAVGRAFSFNGTSDYLIIPSSEVGNLNVGAEGNAVSVFALVRRRSAGSGFLAGLWQEDSEDARRQYGLFIDLPTYGGAEQVIGHVSGNGGPSVGLPYSRDYSATARMVGFDTWRIVGFTYDGRYIRSYLDGIVDERRSFTETDSPLGEGRTYAKNPFFYPDGLNRNAISDFTIGAVRLTGGPGNFFGGEIARLAVWDVPLQPHESMALSRSWTPSGHPIIRSDFFSPGSSESNRQSGQGAATLSLDDVGWRQVRLGASTDSNPSVMFVVKPRPAPPRLTRAGQPPHHEALIFMENVAGLRFDEIERIECETEPREATGGEAFPLKETERCQPALRLDDRWFVAPPRLDLDGRSWTVCPSSEQWCLLESSSDEIVDPEALVSAIGFVARGDGEAVQIRTLEVFASRPGHGTENA